MFLNGKIEMINCHEKICIVKEIMEIGLFEWLE